MYLVEINLPHMCIYIQTFFLPSRSCMYSLSSSTFQKHCYLKLFFLGTKRSFVSIILPTFVIEILKKVVTWYLLSQNSSEITAKASQETLNAKAYLWSQHCQSLQLHHQPGYHSSRPIGWQCRSRSSGLPAGRRRFPEAHRYIWESLDLVNVESLSLFRTQSRRFSHCIWTTRRRWWWRGDR